MKRELATIIMAAGKGTRMKNPDRAKVMFAVDGKPMVEHVVGLASRLHSSRIIAVVGFQRESVIEHVRRSSPEVEFAIQDPQLGTGHAVLQAEPNLAGFVGDVLVLSGDVPLLRPSTIEDLIRHHREKKAVATILTAEPDDPTGYGRIIRDAEGHVTAIVEHRDATEAQKMVKEINSGIYLFQSEQLFEALHRVLPHNVQNEYYLPDVFGYFWKHHLRVAARKSPDFDEIRGVNTVEQLDEAREALERRN